MKLWSNTAKCLIKNRTIAENKLVTQVPIQKDHIISNWKIRYEKLDMK